MKALVRAAGATLLAMSACVANAGPLQSQSLTGGPINFTGFVADTIQAPGSFTDTFTFNLPAPSIVNGQVIAVFDIREAESQQIVFNLVKITSGADTYVFTPGTDIVLGVNVTRFSFVTDNPVGSSFTIEVNGCAGLCGLQGDQPQDISASFSGTFNIRRAVPEPATLALTLVALGGLGVGSRRRHTAPAVV